MNTTTLQVEGMSCGHCVNSIEKALKGAGASGQVDLASKTVEVQYDEAQISLQALKEVIEDQGYEVL
ncbi:cation transporter [Paenibacillus sp. YPG26]|uniref:cation transporter n=1 Tax=Paenibacillus sp. YPG26 TaxID=2878915 RepID=UPI00203E1A8C|nr:cation transporter [Paenibacillus sp. YPG26]USB32686.1 cation transporter [Paenibacillus sp. YPG26]